MRTSIQVQETDWVDSSVYMHKATQAITGVYVFTPSHTRALSHYIHSTQELVYGLSIPGGVNRGSPLSRKVAKIQALRSHGREK